MARNVEIKARVTDVTAVRKRANALPVRATEELEQTDTFFVVPHGRLKLRESSGSTAELIFYERSDSAGPKLSEYQRIGCADPERWRTLLGRALGVRGVVKKQRSVLLVGRTRIHLDRVEGLGDFLELEVILEEGESAARGEAVARELLSALGIGVSSCVSGAYIDLLA